MIPPLHHELAQLRQSEMRQEAAYRRLARQVDRDRFSAPICLPGRNFSFPVTLGRRVFQVLAMSWGLRTAMKATDR
jgi:hypothetical protein